MKERYIIESPLWQLVHYKVWRMENKEGELTQVRKNTGKISRGMQVMLNVYWYIFFMRSLLFCLKDETDKSKKNEAVYDIPFKNRNAEIYIGKTEWSIGICLEEHKKLAVKASMSS